jgi:hypothetical protein
MQLQAMDIVLFDMVEYMPEQIKSLIVEVV